jgi:Regulator of volume decrease after cellular swelling
VEFRSITMHAISNDPGVHAKPCIYCQLDGQDALDIGDDEDLTSNEVMLIPTDTSQGSKAICCVQVCM